ncbi:MAG: ATP-binding protein [Gemmatimonadaceae bacterium]
MPRVRLLQGRREGGWLDLEKLLEDYPLSRQFLEKPSNRVPWETWKVLCDRSAQQLGTPERIRDSGAFAINPDVAGYLGPAVSLFSSPKEIYRIAFRWLCPSVHRAHQFTYAELPDGRLQLCIEVREGHEGSLPFMLMYEGALRAVPRFVKHPDAVVNATLMTDRKAVFVVTPPTHRSFRSRLRRFFSLSRISTDIESELIHQQQQLLATHEQLRSSERMFRSVLESMPVLVAIHRDGRILYANPALADRLGYSRDELLGRSFEDLVPPDDRARLLAFVLDANNRGEQLEQVRMRTAAGAELHIGALGLPDLTFEGESARGLFALDLTAHRHIADELERSEETMQALVNALPDLIVRVDERGVIMDALAGGAMRAAALLRTSRGRPLSELIGAIPGLSRDFLDQGMVVVREAIASGELRSIERIVDYADSPSRVFELRIVPIVARREVVVLIHDVTKRRERERAVAISDRLISLGTLAAGVAHEINNPLTYVMGSLGDIDRGLDQLRHREGSPEVAGIQAALDQAREGVARVTSIVRTLHAFSRVDARTVEAVDVHELLEQAIALTQQEFRHRARLLRNYHASAPARADRVQLVQVFVNLIANAAQAIPEGNREGNELRLVTGEDDSHVWVDVQDTGAGMPPDVLRQVFDPFFTTKPRGRGTGLGLAISHRLVEEFGGVLTAQSVVGKGSVFRVELPRTTSIPEVGPHGPVEQLPPTSAKILVIEDEPAVAAMVERALGDWRPTVVHSGSEALDTMARDAEYDVILCDITMPEMTGVDVYEAATRLHPWLADRFVFLCGGVTTERAQTFLSDGSRVVLWKPFDATELEQLVLQRLSRGGPSAPVAPPTDAVRGDQRKKTGDDRGSPPEVTAR